jgi:hypothetical protein
MHIQVRTDTAWKKRIIIALFQIGILDLHGTVSVSYTRAVSNHPIRSVNGKACAILLYYASVRMAGIECLRFFVFPENDLVTRLSESFIFQIRNVVRYSEMHFWIFNSQTR